MKRKLIAGPKLISITHRLEVGDYWKTYFCFPCGSLCHLSVDAGVTAPACSSSSCTDSRTLAGSSRTRARVSTSFQLSGFWTMISNQKEGRVGRMGVLQTSFQGFRV